MAVVLSLTRGMTTEQKQEFIKRCKASEDVLARFRKIIKAKLEAHDKSRKQPDKYQEAAWPYRQADAIGYMRALEEIDNLFNIETKERDNV